MRQSHTLKTAEAIRHQLKDRRKIRPVIVKMGDMAFSRIGEQPLGTTLPAPIKRYDVKTTV